MEATNVEPLREILMGRLFSRYGELHGEQMSKASFLPDLWRSLSSFTINNCSNPLIQEEARKLEYGDLVHRSFLILSLLYGSYDYKPYKASILKEFVKMLGDDLDKKERRTLKYAEGKSHGFFLELRFVWRTIREIYSLENACLKLLPPTPYQAYSLLVIHRPEVALSSASLDLDVVMAILVELNSDPQKASSLKNPEPRPTLTIVK